MELKKKLNFGFLLAFAFLFFPLVSASFNINDLTNTNIIFNTSVSYSSMTFDSVDVWTDMVVIENDSIAIYNASFTNGALTVNITNNGVINWTDANTHIDSSAFAYITSTADNKVVIHTNLTNSVTGFRPTFSITSDCAKVHSFSYQKNSSATASNIFSPDTLYSCSNKQISLISDLTLDSGDNTFYLSFQDTGTGGGGADVTGASGSNDTLDGFYNRTFLCGEAEKFINFYTKNGVLNYTEEEFQSFKNSIVLQQSFGIEDNILRPFITDFAGNCPDFVDDDGNPINIGGSSDEGFNYTYLWIGLFVLVILIVIILIVMGGNAHKDRTVLMAGLFQRNKSDPSNP